MRHRPNFLTTLFRLYRDDELGVITNRPVLEFERLTKKIRRIFSDAGFKITIEIGSVATNFLDATFDLRNNNFHPFKKPNASINYIHRGSNHPDHIKKALPKMIQKRLSSLSENEATFNRHKTEYEDALRRSGYKGLSLNFEHLPKTRKRCRRKKAIFFNAPFCLSVRTRIAKEFFKIVDRHFTKTHPYYAILNRSTIKLSYSCTMNMASIIKAHNSRILQNAEAQEDKPKRSCNCVRRNKDLCPLQQKCLTENVIYEATVKTSSEEKVYVGSTGRSFKERYGEHKHALRHQGSSQSTELSKYVWAQRAKGEDPTIQWKLLHTIGKPRGPQRVCTTCNLEKMEIAATERRRSLNKRSELTGKCVHFRNFYF